jgi:gliding motility-associated-like protein
LGRKSLLISGLFIAFALQIAAQNGPSGFEFVENKGQWEKQIRYKGELSTGAFYLENNGFTVLLNNPQDLAAFMEATHGSKSPYSKPQKGQTKDQLERIPDVLRSHAYRVTFIGANENAQIIPDKPIQSYNNYFIGNDRSKWVKHAAIYQALLYKNVYPNIDVRYYSENGYLKYDVIVYPGGDPKNIQLKYEGADKLSVRNRELVVKTSVGEVRELYPYAYQFSQTKNREEVTANYELPGGNTVRFRLEKYDPKATLVIDPSLIFCSFTGSRANQYGFTATPAPDGSFFSGGIVFGQGFPVTPGAFQSTFHGSGGRATDIGIMKFSPNGSQRLYATYLGGNGNEYPHSLFSDPQGNLVVMGRSYSTDYPGTRVGPGGSADIVVTKLKADGTDIIGSLTIGGSGNDGLNIEDMQQLGVKGSISLLQNYGDDSRSEVILDGAQNIYVAAQTQSPNFPIIGSVFQTSIGGKQDGAVLKINPDCTAVLWSSFLGGSEDDGAFVLSLNTTTGNLYVAGATSSANFPGNKAGTIGAAIAGGTCDGYVAVISPDGKSLIKSTYLGTNNMDVVYGIQFDRKGFPYVMGITRGDWPVINATYQNPKSKQFVAKLKPDLSSYVYSTVFGSGAPSPNMSPVAFLVDRCENVYISGWGGWITPGQEDRFNQAGVAGMPITQDAIKSTTDNKDFYFIVIKKDAQGLLYGSFFGQDGAEGEHVDGGTSRYDQQGVIFQAICSNCGGGARFPTTPGVVGPVNGALPDGCNLAAVKILFNFAGVASGPKAYFNGVPDSVGCVPFTVVLRDTVRNAKAYEWQFGDGSPDVQTTNFEVTHTFNTVGIYRVRLIAIDSTTCNIRDTAYIHVKVSSDIAALNFNSTKLPPCESLSYLFNNLSTAPASKPFGAQSFTWDFGDGTRITGGTGSITHSYSAPGSYNVRLIITDTAYCNAPDSMTIALRVAPLVKAQFDTPPVGCVPYEAALNNTSLAGQQFFWDFGDGTTSNDVNPTHLYNSVGTYRIKLVAVDPQTCNQRDSTEKVITVTNKPTAAFTTSPNPPQENKPTVFLNQSTGGTRYKWLFGDGDSTEKNTMDTVIHQYNATGVYNACLITYNEAGCTDTACNSVQAVIVPLLDVPNAFTPGRFGRNSIVKVEGFGITRMTFRIYNRFGQKVFESNDRSIGWDGTFNGKPQPMDVYAYTLDVEFSDKTTTRKTGDITLIR